MLNFRKPLILTLWGLIGIGIVCLFSYSAIAATIATLGNYNSSGQYDIAVDHEHQIDFWGGTNLKYEIVTTSDTLTAAESGTVYVIREEHGITTLTLPDAELGINYTFIPIQASNDSLKANANVGRHQKSWSRVYIDPQSTDRFINVDGLTSLMSEGDKLANPATSGDSLTILCTQDHYWAVVNMVNAWTDGN